MSHPRQKSPFEFTGGHLCLNFTNTVNDRTSGHPKELLNSYDALLLWGSEAGMLQAKMADKLRTLAKHSPGRAQSTVREATRLRDALYDIFNAVVEEHKVPEASLEFLNQALQRASEHARLVHEPRRFSWQWVDPEENLDSILWPVARSAGDLLTSDELLLVGQCAASDCGWLFLDTTKNHRRRWCDMRTCGNRDKARRYYQRARH